MASSEDFFFSLGLISYNPRVLSSHPPVYRLGGEEAQEAGASEEGPGRPHGRGSSRRPLIGRELLSRLLIGLELLSLPFDWSSVWVRDMRRGVTVGDMAASSRTPSTASCEERTRTILIGFGGEFSFFFCFCDLL